MASDFISGKAATKAAKLARRVRLGRVMILPSPPDRQRGFVNRFGSWVDGHGCNEGHGPERVGVDFVPGLLLPVAAMLEKAVAEAAEHLDHAC